MAEPAFVIEILQASDLMALGACAEQLLQGGTDESEDWIESPLT
jgi:hypothetical protein